MPYKFEKIPNRIKNLIKTGENIKTGQRNYDSYTPELFQQRLEFYGDRIEDEQILKYIVEFSSCKFEREDINMLKMFLQGADSVWDGKMTIKEFLEHIYRNSLDKNILKSIIENNYLFSETSAKAVMTDAGNKRITATIMPEAKQGIYDYYKFPKCLEYFSAFEDALTQFAVNKNSSGIKRLGKNNDSMKDVIELKIKGYSDRLVDYTGSYKFNTFSNTGFH